LLKLTNH